MENNNKDDLKDLENIEELDDTEYYNELYNDVSKEVRDILMETHPLRGKGLNSETASYRTRKRELSEVDLVKKARSEQVKKEINKDFGIEFNQEDSSKKSQNNIEKFQKLESESDITIFDELKKKSKKIKGSSENIKKIENSSENRNKNASNSSKIKKEDYNNIQTVKMKPSSKNTVQEKPIENTAKKKKSIIKSSKKQSESSFKNMNNDLDLDRITKDAALNELYRAEDFVEEDKFNLPSNKKVVMGAGAVFIILFIFFAIKTITLSGQLHKANEELKEFATTQEQNEELKMEILSLQEELEKYTGTGEKKETTTTDTGNFDTYIVVPGDTFGSIATKIYGNFADYTKILEANGLTENSSLQIGQVLKIPK